MGQSEKIASLSANDALAESVVLIEASFGSGDHPSGNDPVVSAFRHHFHKPGKMTRARVALETASALSLPQKSALAIAACVESLHNASLVQDDLQDGALERRGQPTVSAAFGRDVALGLTTRLITSAFVSLHSCANSHHLPRMVTKIHRAVGLTIEGQTRDLEAATGRTVKDLLLIARRKSGPLFALAVELPLIASGEDAAVAIAQKAACHFGLGYQIVDDLKDRTTDALQPTDANIVNAMAAQDGTLKAINEAKALAHGFLRRSIHLAAELPSDSGASLQALALHELSSLDHSHG